MATDDKAATAVAAEPSPAVQVDDRTGTEVLKSLSPTQRKKWRETGDLPEAKKEEPAAKKDSQTAAADSSPAAKTEDAAPEPVKAKVEEPAKSASADKEPPKANAETRIRDLLSQNKELKAKLDELQAKPPVAASAKTEEPAKPHRNDVDTKTGQPKYATDEAFDAAYETYMTEKVGNDVRKQMAKEETDRRVAEQNTLIQKRLQNALRIAQEKHADFNQVLKVESKDGKTQFNADAVKMIKTNGVLDAWILDSEIGAEILYFLCKNPAEVERIQGMTAFSAARELTKLEEKLSAPEKKEAPAESSPASTDKKPKVPPEPAASVRGKSTAPADEELAATEAGDFRRYSKAANENEWRKKKAS